MSRQCRAAYDTLAMAARTRVWKACRSCKWPRSLAMSISIKSSGRQTAGMSGQDTVCTPLHRQPPQLERYRKCKRYFATNTVAGVPPFHSGGTHANATRQALEIAGVKNERRLFPVACTRLFAGSAQGCKWVRPLPQPRPLLGLLPHGSSPHVAPCRAYLITSSARDRNIGESVRPRAWAS